MRCEGLNPDKKSINVVLRACAIEEGVSCFEKKEDEYGIAREVEHYVGVVDVLGRAGHVKEAEEFIERWTVPFEAAAEAWEALRDSARVHDDLVPVTTSFTSSSREGKLIS